MLQAPGLKQVSFNSIEWIRLGGARATGTLSSTLSIPLNGFLESNYMVEVTYYDKHAFNSIEWIPSDIREATAGAASSTLSIPLNGFLRRGSQVKVNEEVLLSIPLNGF